jgi:hypothetical protein
MLYPLIKECDVNPRVTMRNIVVRNVHMHGGVFPPGVIRCNATNPCTGFEFENVTVTGWFTPMNIGFITENAYGTAVNVVPDPGFNTTSVDSQKVDEIAFHMRSSDKWFNQQP